MPSKRTITPAKNDPPVARARSTAAQEVTRHIPARVSNMLSARAAGRCQFNGHNLLLGRSPVTQETANIGQKAHIWSFAEGAARGRDGLDLSQINAVDNLMLVCHGCHQ